MTLTIVEIPEILRRPVFPLVIMRGNEGKEYAGLNDHRTLCSMVQQEDFALFALMYSCDVDKVHVSDEVQKLAAKEWQRRYPAPLPDTALWWRKAAATKAVELCA